MTLWSDKDLWKYKKATGLKGIYIKLDEYVSKKMVIYLFGLLKAYGRPLGMKFR